MNDNDLNTHTEPTQIEGEQLLESMLNRLDIACRFVAPDGTVLWQSDALTRMTGAESPQRCCEALGVAHSDEDCCSLRTIREERSVKRAYWLGRHYVSVETLPAHGLFGHDVLSFETVRDIAVEKRLEAALTEQQQLLETINRAMIEVNQRLEEAQNELEDKNRSLAQANDQLRTLDQLKDDFLSIVSHELKAPLTSIKGSVELIRACERDTLTSAGQELLSVCQRSTDRLQRLVQDLLDITRIESGCMSLDFTSFSVTEMVTECVVSLKPLAVAKNLTIETHLPEGLEMEGDRDRLLQVLVNLLNNAIKFASQGGVTVDAEAAPGRIVFRVTDTGPGIPDDERTRIFDKFVQIADPVQHCARGTGLGLPIARGIVREHGGDIFVTGKPGEGSCFEFAIPQPPGKVVGGEIGPLD